MDWNDLIQKRHTTFAWEDTPVDKELLLEVFKEVYENIPSKNLKFPYTVTAYDNSNFEIRKEIMTICHRNQDKDIDRDLGNPQVLAPILLAFSRRNYKELETLHQKTYTWTDKELDRYGFLEIGIVASYIQLALTNRGIQTGFCQNINQNAERAQEIFGTEYPVALIMGVGYGKDPTVQHTYIDPRVERERRIPYPPSESGEVYPRPEFNKIFKIGLK